MSVSPRTSVDKSDQDVLSSTSAFIFRTYVSPISCSAGQTLRSNQNTIFSKRYGNIATKLATRSS